MKEIKYKKENKKKAERRQKAIQELWNEGDTKSNR